MNEPTYVEAIGRNPGEELQHSHLYRHELDGGYGPMCIYGWNRSDGERISIFRGNGGRRGLCKVCERRAALNLEPFPPTPHKTKWL